MKSFGLGAGLFFVAFSLASALCLAIPTPPRQSHFQDPAEKQIRVRTHGATGIVAIRGVDLVLEDGRGVTLASQGLKQWLVYCRERRVELVDATTGKMTPLQSFVRVRSPAGFVSVNSRPFREEVVIYDLGQKLSACEVVNHLSLEKYLVGLVNGEFNSKWNPEAIAAQVIAARSYAYYQILEAARKRAHYDVESTIADQVYDGPEREDHRAAREVEKTRGLALGFEESEGFKPLKAFYHSTCGGETELPQNVWAYAQGGFKSKVRCPFCRNSPRYLWTVAVKSSDILSAVRKGGLAEGVPQSWPGDWNSLLLKGELVAVTEVHDPQASRNVGVRLAVRGVGLKTLELPASRFRNWLGTTRVRSTHFKVEADPLSRQSWKISGIGNGHGVGLCQWGTKAMGERGYSAQAILKFYYPEATLKKLW